MVLAFVNTLSHPRKLFTAVIAARTKIYRLKTDRLASTSGIRIPGVSLFIIISFFAKSRFCDQLYFFYELFELRGNNLNQNLIS